MGVDVSTHLFYGIKLKLNEFEAQIEQTLKEHYPDFEGGYYEFLEKEIGGAPGRDFDIVIDYMMGKYIILGKDIAHADKRDEKFYEISVDLLPDRIELIGMINRTLKTSYLPSDFKLFFFNHFS